MTYNKPQKISYRQFKREMLKLQEENVSLRKELSMVMETAKLIKTKEIKC